MGTINQIGSTGATSGDEAPLINGAYQVVRTLGEGHQGRVVLATDVRTNTDVALKICPANDDTSQAELSFISSNINHENLVHSASQFEESGAMHFVMEYIKTDLFDVLSRSDHLPIDELRIVARFVLEGLKAMHNNDFAHRDVKPENILLGSTTITPQCAVKLADFGLVHETSTEPMAHTFCGTEEYCAPEVLQLLPYDPKAADIWSLGVVCFNAFSSFSPWDAATPEHPLYRCYSNEVTGPGRATFWEWADSYSLQPTTALFRDLFEGMCNLDPSERLTAQECLDHPFFSVTGGVIEPTQR